MLIISDGIKVSEGVAIGRIVVLEKRHLEIDGLSEKYIEDSEKPKQQGKFDSAIIQTSDELSILAQSNTIFAAQKEIANDLMLLDLVRSNIENNLSAEWALIRAKEELITIFESIEDTYLSERVADVKDVCDRILVNIVENKDKRSYDSIDNNSIIVAEELMPSDTACLDLNRVAGFITAKGGLTSHFCIIARSRSIPTIIGVEGVDTLFKNSDIVILDADKSKIIIDPDNETLAAYEEIIATRKKEHQQLEVLKSERLITPSGRVVDLLANAGSIDEVELAIERGAEGIGLFRSEFLFMNSTDFPSEEYQFNIYKNVAEICGKHPITIRTLDIGGDKELPYHEIGREDNPALGMRAIRFSFARPDIFKTQLRAILRASIYGNVKIMFPLIISVEELDRALKMVDECKKELDERKQAYDPHIPVGIMIETPASVFIADELIKKSDFFSIGTNDLTQYTLAVDRGNVAVSHLYDSMHPAVMNAIKTVVKTALDHNKDVCMCGDLASNAEALNTLLAIGLNKYSVSINLLLPIKKKLLTEIKSNI